MPAVRDRRHLQGRGCRMAEIDLVNETPPELLAARQRMAVVHSARFYRRRNLNGYCGRVEEVAEWV